MIGIFYQRRVLNIAHVQFGGEMDKSDVAVDDGYHDKAAVAARDSGVKGVQIANARNSRDF